MKTVNISLKDADHKKLVKIKQLLNLPNFHETLARMIKDTYNRLSNSLSETTGDS